MKESDGSKYRNSIPNTYCSSVLSCNTSLHLRQEQSHPQSPYRAFSNQTHIIRKNKNITPDWRNFAHIPHHLTLKLSTDEFSVVLSQLSSTEKYILTAPLRSPQLWIFGLLGEEKHTGSGLPTGAALRCLLQLVIVIAHPKTKIL